MVVELAPGEYLEYGEDLLHSGHNLRGESSERGQLDQQKLQEEQLKIQAAFVSFASRYGFSGEAEDQQAETTQAASKRNSNMTELDLKLQQIA